MYNFLKDLFGPKYQMGSLKSPTDPRNVSLASFIQPIGLPDEFETDMGVVDNQGSKSCCVGCAITKVMEYQLGVDLSYDDLYEQCKAIDGIPTVLGTYPSVGAFIAHKNGIASLAAYESKNSKKIEESRAKNKVEGYAFVDADYDLICQAIYKSGAITAAFLVDSNWFRGIIQKVLKYVGGHYVVLKGFKLSENKLKGRNSWGYSWIGYIAGLINSKIKPGEFEMNWDDYKDNIYDIIAFTFIPKEIKDEAVKYDYRFMSTMKFGSKGFEVKKLQERLKLVADGSFGNKTKQAVIQLQKENGLVADGIVGPGTRKLLNINAKSLIETWAKAIQDHEGYYKGSRSYRNNNPANFKSGTLTSFMAGLGATGVDTGGFRIFPSYEVGFKALCSFLTMACNDELSSYRPSMTLYQFYQKYAPSSDGNNTLAYAKTVAAKLGGTINTKIEELL